MPTIVVFVQLISYEQDSGAQDEKTDEDVINVKTEPIKAFERFGGKIFDPSQPVGKTAQVYDATTKEDAKFESPLQKFKRLSSEVSGFRDELQEIAAKVEHMRVHCKRGIALH